MRNDEERVSKEYSKELVLVKLEKEKGVRIYRFKDDENEDYVHYQVPLASITTKSKAAICAARRWIKFFNDDNLGRRLKCHVVMREMGGGYSGSFGATSLYRNVESFSEDCVIDPTVVKQTKTEASEKLASFIQNLGI